MMATGTLLDYFWRDRLHHAEADCERFQSRV